MTCPATTSVGQAFTAYERRRLIGRGVILPPLTGNSCSPSAERPDSGRSGREAIAVERAPFAAQPPARRRDVAVVQFIDERVECRAMVHVAKMRDFMRNGRAPDKIGRAHVRTPVTNAPHVCRLLLEKKKLNSINRKTPE